MWPRNVQQREYPYNEFNGCLLDEATLWMRINQCGGLTAICPGHGYAVPPWIRMPPQGKRYSKISSIALPAADGADHLVTSFLVPTGYDGIISSVVQTYTGTGFVEGSGVLSWRLRLNLRWVKDYGNTTTQIGSLLVPYSVNTGQILLQSRQLVQYFVNRQLGDVTLAGGRVICALFGYWWPR